MVNDSRWHCQFAALVGQNSRGDGVCGNQIFVDLIPLVLWRVVLKTVEKLYCKFRGWCLLFRQIGAA